MKSFKQIKGPVKGIVRARTFLKQVTVNKLKKTLFSDEKIFKVQDHRNWQNCLVYALCDQKMSDFNTRDEWLLTTILCKTVQDLTHTAKSVVEYLNSHVPEFIKANAWDTSSPDLNPMN